MVELQAGLASRLTAAAERQQWCAGAGCGVPLGAVCRWVRCAAGLRYPWPIAWCGAKHAAAAMSGRRLDRHRGGAHAAWGPLSRSLLTAAPACRLPARVLASHLALALACLLARCGRIAPANVIPDAVALFLPACAPGGAADAAPCGPGAPPHPPAALAAAAALMAGARHGAGPALGLLCVLAALPEATASRHCLVTPDRRGALLGALRASGWPAPLLCGALRARAALSVSLGCRALQAWCAEAGAPPAGLASDPEALEIAAAALMSGDTHAAAADCLTALLDCCRRAGGGPAASASSSEGMSLGSGGTGGGGAHGARGAAANGSAGGVTAAAASPPELFEKLFAALETQLVPVVDAAGAESSLVAAAAAAGAVGLGPQAEASFCAVLAAAAGALLGPTLSGGALDAGAAAAPAPRLALLQRLQARLLGSLGQPDGGAVLGALLFWQNVYLAALSKLPRDDVAALLAGPQRGVLEALIGALVARTRLAPGAAAAATADARDLPEDLRAVSRALRFACCS
jgi:hypothetical protein